MWPIVYATARMQTRERKTEIMKPEGNIKFKEEVVKQLEAGFLEVTIYPEWLAKIVSVPKKDGNIMMCVDYRDLNKASQR